MPIEDKKIPATSDFVVLFFVGAILAIDFLPYFKTSEIINPQFLYLSVINILMGGYFYFYFYKKDKLQDSILIFKNSYLTKLYVAFVLLCGLSVFVAKNVSLVMTDFTQILIVFLLFINLSILLKDKLSIFYKIVFIVGISTFLQSWQALNDLMATANRSTLVEGLNLMKGNTGSINILAASLSIKIPFVLLGITHYAGYKKWFLSLALFFAVTTIFLTGARTAFINLFLIFIIYIVYYLKNRSFQKGAFIKSSILIIPVIAAALVSNIILEKSQDQGRYASLTNRIESIGVQEGSFQVRLSMWDNALKLYKTSPLLGVGLGNYRIESLPYEREAADDLIVYLHAHNDFLEIFAETGIINGFIYLSLFVLIFVINLKRIIQSNDDTVKAISVLVLLLVIVYGIDSLFNFPMYRPTMQIFLSIMFALTVINNPVLMGNHSNVSKGKINFYPVILIFSSLTCYSAFLLYKASNLEYSIKSDNINKNASGVLNGDEVINRLPLYPNVFATSESFYEYAGIYYFREKNYDKAFKSFYRAGKINPYSGRIDYYKYLIAKERGYIDSAYVHVKNAFYRKPRNLIFYQECLNNAASRKDTLEIFKEHKLFIKYRNIPQAWKDAAFALQTAGYNRKKLHLFIDEGLKELPGDSVLLRQKTDFMITDLIIEGQKFASQGNPQKSLETYTKALKIDPENIYAMQNIGFHYYNQGQFKKAIGYFQKALKSPGLNDGHTEYYIAASYLQINDTENACRFFNLSKAKNYPAAQQQLDQYCK